MRFAPHPRTAPVSQPVLIATDFVARQHRSLILQDSHDRAFQQPTIRCAPQITIVRAADSSRQSHV